jgi:hypothetical protein
MLSSSLGGSATTYVYNGDGVRDHITPPGSPSAYFIWDFAAGLPVVLHDGWRVYIYGLGREVLPLTMAKSCAVAWAFAACARSKVDPQRLRCSNAAGRLPAAPEV